MINNAVTYNHMTPSGCKLQETWPDTPTKTAHPSPLVKHSPLSVDMLEDSILQKV